MCLLISPKELIVFSFSRSDKYKFIASLVTRAIFALRDKHFKNAWLKLNLYRTINSLCWIISRYLHSFLFCYRDVNLSSLNDNFISIFIATIAVVVVVIIIIHCKKLHRLTKGSWPSFLTQRLKIMLQPYFLWGTA